MAISEVCTPDVMPVDPITGLEGNDRLDATTATRRLGYAGNFFGRVTVSVELIGQNAVKFDGVGCVGRAIKYISRCAEERTNPRFLVTVS